MFLKSSKLTFPRTHAHNPGAVNAAIKQKQTYYSHVQIEFGDNLLCTHVVPSRQMPAARGNRTRASLISHEIAIGREYGRVTCGRPAAAECARATYEVILHTTDECGAGDDMTTG